MPAGVSLKVGEESVFCISQIHLFGINQPKETAGKVARFDRASAVNAQHFAFWR